MGQTRQREAKPCPIVLPGVFGCTRRNAFLSVLALCYAELLEGHLKAQHIEPKFTEIL